MRAPPQAPPFRGPPAVTGCRCRTESRTMPDNAPQFFTTPDGLKLAYADQGRGIPLLCLAGLTRNMEDFEPALPVQLSAQVQVLQRVVLLSWLWALPSSRNRRAPLRHRMRERSPANGDPGRESSSGPPPHRRGSFFRRTHPTAPSWQSSRVFPHPRIEADSSTVHAVCRGAPTFRTCAVGLLCTKLGR